MSATQHPYKTKPSRAFWSRSVSRDFDPRALVESQASLIRRGENVVSAGSCFASNLVPFLEGHGLTYVRTESIHPAFAPAAVDDTTIEQANAALRPAHSQTLAARALRRLRGAAPLLPGSPASDDFGYANFSAAYGNIYTVRQLLQLVRRATGHFTPTERYWLKGAEVVDPFRPGLRHKARSVTEFDALTDQHLRKTRQAFATADVFVLTLGLTEAWISRDDGAVFPACPGTVAGTFDPDRHLFHNFTAAETSADLDAVIAEIREINPDCRFIITVSPVPLVATATDQHVLCASIYSKSVLRVAAQDAAARHQNVTYFPAYEIVTGPQAPRRFLAPDLRNVTSEGVAAVMSALLAHCDGGGPAVAAETTARPVAAKLSATIVEAECEEMMSER